MSAYSNPTVVVFTLVEELEGGEGALISAVPAHFDTIADMLASNTLLWINAYCDNITGSDGAVTVWMRLPNSLLTDNGNDVREAADGEILLRTFP